MALVNASLSHGKNPSFLYYSDEKRPFNGRFDFFLKHIRSLDDVILFNIDERSTSSFGEEPYFLRGCRIRVDIARHGVFSSLQIPDACKHVIDISTFKDARIPEIFLSAALASAGGSISDAGLKPMSERI